MKETGRKLEEMKANLEEMAQKSDLAHRDIEATTRQANLDPEGMEERKAKEKGWRAERQRK
eukprot:14237055-Alexandrium_andersonii.AAC.1